METAESRVGGRRISSRRERKREAKRREMLEVAMEIVAEQGLEALTIARLASALDAAVGGLYRYFPSKDALLVQLQVQALEDFQASLEEELEAAVTRFPEEGEASAEALALARVLLRMQCYLDDATRAPQRHRLMMAFLSTMDPSLSEEGALEGGRVVASLLAPLQEELGFALGCEDEELTAQRAHVLWATLHGLGLFRKRDRIQPPSLQSTQLLPLAQRTLLRGWGAEESLLDAAFACFRAALKAPLGFQ